MRSVIFDLDGTLADTSGDLIAAANACLAQMDHGVRLCPSADAATALLGGKAMLRLAFSRAPDPWDETAVAAAYPRLLRCYAEALDTHTTLYPGAVEAVQTLRARGFAVAVCTNKPEAMAQSLLVSLGVRDLFGALIGADTLPQRKPDPRPFHAAVAGAGGAPGRALLLGDSVTDRDTARAAGAPCVLVDFAPGGGDVHALAPDAVLSHFDDLPDLAADLLGR